MLYRRAMSHRLLAALALPFFLTAACVESDDKGPEEEVPGEGKDDSFAKPTYHGDIGLNTFPAPEATLTATERHHTWTFSLTDNASVHAFTGPSLTGRMVIDTVLYLYKQKADGSWGAYLARNDDYQGSLFSSLTRNLGAGTYRILVKGYAASTRGQFSAHVECEGAGCAAAPTCLFGTTFGELLENPAVGVTGDRQLRVTDPLSPLDQQRIILAVQQSSHTDVMTVAEAFDAVDQNVIRRVDLYDETGARAFVAFEYGAGDNSYGAVFAYGSTELVSQIHDGDLLECTAVAETCALGGNWYDTRNNGSFTRISTNVVTAASQLSGVDATNALAAIRVAYAESTSLADGLTRIDGDTLNVVDLRDNATSVVIRAYEYGAGDNSYGAIYRANTAERVATIVDLTYYDCSLFR